MKSLNKFLILSFFIFSIPSIGFALPKCGNTLHNCTGTYTWENGDEYDGDFLNDKKHGKGRYTWKSGSKYEGDWVNGKRTGEGVLTFANGKKQEGVFKNSKFLYSKKIDKQRKINKDDETPLSLALNKKPVEIKKATKKINKESNNSIRLLSECPSL
ncbi:hypothetical protein N9T54_00390 [Alphaproteobacteria bacterium]|nr:hypothetical protein [Alphaproteobacteria bacterium]